MAVDPDTINTNIFGSKNLGFQMTQDIAAHVAADAAVEMSLKKGITQGLKAVGIKSVRNRMLVSAKNLKRLSKSLVRKAKNTVIRSARSLGKKAISALAKKTAEKVAVKATEKVATTALKAAGKEAIQAFGVGAEVCAITGPETLGIGCVVGAAVTVVMLAFDITNLLAGLLDKSGITVILHRKDIDDMAETFRKQLLQDDHEETYLEDEIFFDPLLFVFDTDPKTQQLVVDDVWGPKYNAYQDEYMKSIGITGDWRSRVEAHDFEQPPKQPPKPVNRNILILIIGIVAIILLILIVNVSGDSNTVAN